MTKKPGEVVYSKMQSGPEGLKGRVVLSDTHTKTVEYVNINKGGLYGVAGLSYSDLGDCRSIVVHSRKTAALYEHIAQIGEIHGLDRGGMDSVVIGTGRCLKALESDGVLAGRIAISTPGRVVELAGEKLSVVRVWEKNIKLPKLFSLYDFLVWCGTISGVVISSYNTIYIYHERSQIAHYITFKTTAESQRFLVKMGLEMSSLINR